MLEGVSTLNIFKFETWPMYVVYMTSCTASPTSLRLTSISLLDALADAAAKAAPGSAGLIREFRDEQYHRTGFTIGGESPSAVAAASIEVSRRALRAVDLRQHEASHPRIGVVDHVSVHPLGEGGEEAAKEAGLAIAMALGEEGVPVLLYGDLKNGRRLAEVRSKQSTEHVLGNFDARPGCKMNHSSSRLVPS